MSEKKYGMELLRELSLAFAPSGCEGNVAALLREQIADCCDEIYTDRLYNLIAVRKGNGKSTKRMMLSAHMDEVGFMITHIDDDGYLHFTTVGGIDARVLCGRKVTIGDENRKISGIISSKAIHLQTAEERKEATPMDKMYIDIGAFTKEEAEAVVHKGDFGTFDSDFVSFGENEEMIKAKAIDDRFGCAILCDVLRELEKEKIRTNFDLYFAFTVREEVGLSGAIPAAFGIHPEKAIVLEATAIADIVDVPEQAQVAHIGEGGAISMMDNGTIYNFELVQFALDTAKRHSIPCQLKKYVSGGNDAAHIHKSGSGVKVVAISAPCRYIHTGASVMAKKDYGSVKDLVYHLLQDMNIDG